MYNDDIGLGILLDLREFITDLFPEFDGYVESSFAKTDEGTFEKDMGCIHLTFFKKRAIEKQDLINISDKIYRRVSGGKVLRKALKVSLSDCAEERINIIELRGKILIRFLSYLFPDSDYRNTVGNIDGGILIKIEKIA